MSQYKQVKKKLIDKQNKRMRTNGFSNIGGGGEQLIDEYEAYSQKVFPLKK